MRHHTQPSWHRLSHSPPYLTSFHQLGLRISFGHSTRLFPVGNTSRAIYVPHSGLSLSGHECFESSDLPHPSLGEDPSGWDRSHGSEPLRVLATTSSLCVYRWTHLIHDTRRLQLSTPLKKCLQCLHPINDDESDVSDTELRPYHCIPGLPLRQMCSRTSATGFQRSSTPFSGLLVLAHQHSSLPSRALACFAETKRLPRPTLC